MRRAGAVAFALAILLLGVAAKAEGPAERLAAAASALEGGDVEAAIASLEALADRGEVHPDLSFSRGIAYAARARGRSAQPGDLGRAAAGLEETLLLRPSDGEAREALSVVRGEIARRRAKRGKDEVSVGDPPDRLVVGLAGERTWAGLACASSVVLAAGLVLRRRPGGSARVAGFLAAPLGLLGVLAFGLATWWSGVLERERGFGVVVAPEVALQTSSGARADAPLVPEGARVETAEVVDGRVRARWGSYEGWAPVTSIRRLAR